MSMRKFTTLLVRFKSPYGSMFQGIDLANLVSDEPKKIKKSAPVKTANVKSFNNSVTGPILNSQYQLPSYKKPTQLEISSVNHFYNIAKKKLNWCIYKYENIPGEDERLAREQELVESMENIETEIDSKSDYVNEFGEIPENEQNRRTKLLKKDALIKSNYSLPEVLFLGRCNVGKSSLINGIFNDLSNKDTLFNYAKVKDFPGLTPSLNFFNLGGLLRVVDSPGYGIKGKPWQGELTLEYIENRRNLKKLYVLISMKDGVKETDLQIIEFLVAHRIPFDFVITKIDKLAGKLSRAEYIDRVDEYLMPNLIIDDPVLQPNFHFVNNVSGTLQKRTGIQELRVDILKTCGYERVVNLKPVYVVDPQTLDKRQVRKVGEMDEVHLRAHSKLVREKKLARLKERKQRKS